VWKLQFDTPTPLRGEGVHPIAYGDTIASAKLNSTIGVFALPAMKISEQFELFGRLGLVHTRLDLGGGGASDETGTSTPYGVGVNWHFNQDMHGQLAYTSLYDRNNATVDGVTLGIGMDF
jgi:opacity protein-like surface antigen